MDFIQVYAFIIYGTKAVICGEYKDVSVTFRHRVFLKFNVLSAPIAVAALSKAGYRLRAATAGAANSFVCLLCSCPASKRGSHVPRHKTVSTERAQNTEIPLPRDKELLRFDLTCAKFARSNIVSTLRGKATNIASRGSCAQLILGFRHEIFSPARTLGLWIQIPLKAWMSVRVYSVSVR
jgi:hypothetical protein